MVSVINKQTITKSQCVVHHVWSCTNTGQEKDYFMVAKISPFPGPNRVYITCVYYIYICKHNYSLTGFTQIRFTSIVADKMHDFHGKILTSVDFIHNHCIMVKSPWFLVNQTPFATQSPWKVAPVGCVHHRACEGFLRNPRECVSHLESGWKLVPSGNFT